MTAAVPSHIGDDAVRRTGEKAFVVDPFGRGVTEKPLEKS